MFLQESVNGTGSDIQNYK